MNTNYSASTLFLLPMLERHPEEYPFFIDCFTTRISKNTSTIIILTETGLLQGMDLDSFELVKKYIETCPGYTRMNRPHLPDLKYYQWEFSPHFGIWGKDFNNLIFGHFEKVSLKYLKAFKQMFPEVNYNHLAIATINKLKQQYDHATH